MVLQLELQTHLSRILKCVTGDLKRAEEAVRESESRFRAIFNQQFQFMAMLSPQGVVRACNDTFFAATGVRRPVTIVSPRICATVGVAHARPRTTAMRQTRRAMSEDNAGV